VISCDIILLCKLLDNCCDSVQYDKYTASRPNVIKIDPYNFELYRFKFGAFFSETQRRIQRYEKMQFFVGEACAVLELN